MTSQGNEKSTFTQKTFDILTVTSEMRNLFDKLNHKPIKDWRGRVTDTSFDATDAETLKVICETIEKLKDKNTLEVFKNCFNPNTIAGTKITYYLLSNKDLKTKVDKLLKGALDEEIDALQTNTLNAVDALKSGGAVASAVSKMKKNAGIQSVHDEKLSAIQMGAEDPIDKFVIHINNNLQNLTKLDVEISKLLALQDSKTLRNLRDDVRETFDIFKSKLLHDDSFLMQSGQTMENRISNFSSFILSTEYQSMAYVIADIKFRFTNQIVNKISKYEKVLQDNPEVFGLDRSKAGDSLSKQAYQQIRDNSGIRELASQNLDIDAPKKNEPIMKVVQNIKDINAYMDGMISVKALLEARHKKTILSTEIRPGLDRKKVSNAILLGLDPDLGFNDEIKKKYGDNYNAYLSGCVEECLVTSSPELFSRNQEDNRKGLLQINKKDGIKHALIQKALGMPELSDEQKKNMLNTGVRDELGFADITKFNLGILEHQYVRSEKKAKRTLQNYTEPLWRILAAIKPIKSIEDDPLSKEAKEDPIYIKITNYQKILDTMKIYWLPNRGRARINLDLDNGAGLMQQGRGVIDRMLHLMNLHSKELSELPTEKLKNIRTTNEELFTNFDTNFLVRGIKKFAKGFGEGAYYVTHWQSAGNLESEHKRRKMQYLKLDSELSEKVGADEFAAGKVAQQPKLASQYVIEKLGKDQDSLKRYVQLKDEDFERLIKNWKKECPEGTDINFHISDKICEYVENNVVDSNEYKDVKQSLQDKMLRIYENMKLTPPRFEENIEKYNSPTLLLKALSEEINKQRQKIDPLDLETDIYKAMKPVEGKVVKELTRGQMRQALVAAKEFYAVDINKLSNEQLITRYELCNNKIQQSNLSNDDKIKLYQEMSKCHNLIQVKESELNRSQNERFRSVRFDSPEFQQLNEQIKSLDASNLRSQNSNSSKIYDSVSLGGGRAEILNVDEIDNQSNRSSRSPAISFFPQESEQPRTKEEFLNKFIYPYMDEDGNFPENKVAELEGLVNKWNEDHPNDQITSENDEDNLDNTLSTK